MKKALSLMVASILILSLAACGGKDSIKVASSPNPSPVGASPSATKSKDPVTIRVGTIDAELTKEMIKEFEDTHPGIKIQREDLDNTKLAAQFATNDAPDLIRTGGAAVPGLVVKGIPLDLTSYFKNSSILKEDDFLPVADLFRFDGKKQGVGPRYGIEKDWSPSFNIWYNKKLFEAAGVKVPDPKTVLTWSQLIELGKQLTIKKGDQIVQYGMGTWGKTQMDILALQDYALSKGVRMYSDDYSKADFTKPELKTALKLWTDAVKADIGPNVVNADKAGWGGEAFLSEKAAMIVTGYWFSATLRSDVKAKAHLDDFGMLPAPIADGGQRVAPTGGATGMYINKNTKHPGEAWQVFEWYFGGKPAEDRAKTGSGVPVLNHLLSLMPQQTDFDKRVYNTLQEDIKYNGPLLEVNPFLLNPGALIDKYITPVYFNKSSIDDALKNLTEEANKQIQESMNAVSK